MSKISFELDRRSADELSKLCPNMSAGVDKALKILEGLGYTIDRSDREYKGLIQLITLSHKDKTEEDIELEFEQRYKRELKSS